MEASQEGLKNNSSINEDCRGIAAKNTISAALRRRSTRWMIKLKGGV